MNHRPCYILRAKGDSVLGWPFKKWSKIVFARREDAEAHIPEFRERCLDEKHFDFAYAKGLEIQVVELEFYD